MAFTLRHSPASPFVRKVRIAAGVLGLTDEMALEAADTLAADDSIRQQNPLGKIPALILEDGRALYDSRVIIEYLETVSGGGRLIPAEIDAKFEALRLAALCDGILEAAILIVYEVRYRPDQVPHMGWLNLQKDKIRRALKELENNPPDLSTVTVGNIGAACALGYLDFRNQVDWRTENPGLIGWLDDFAAKVPAFDETKPPT